MTDETPTATTISAPSPSTLIGAGLGTPLAVVVVWAIETYTHATVPGVVAAAFGALLSALVGYFPRGGNAGNTMASK
jgi:hypothetical protein